MREFPKISRFGEQAVLFEWNAEISHQTHIEVLTFQEWIEVNFSETIIEVVPAYASLVIYFKDKVDVNDWILHFRTDNPKKEHSLTKSRLVHIPVCYDEEFGLDLHEMSSLLQLTPKEIIKKHTSAIYRVYFLGFLPGFPYLGGLDPKISIKRKSTPRSLVKEGAIGIAGKQTGIYPLDSPGGWNIIGKSPLIFFDTHKKKPNLLKAGDSMRFYSITKAEFDAIKNDLNKGGYQLKTENIDA